MRYKILTVDDSKTVRIIVRKAFKSHDCDIIEAANGVEGLAVAAKESPDLILLDVTMPVMDGVEMLTKLKADPILKAIPVIMLTAEGGRDNVLRIAKIGVRDYLVKPFREEVLVEKCSRIIDLKPVGEYVSKVKSITDPANILIVEDKPAIFQQIHDGLKHTPWILHCANTQDEAVDYYTKSVPDLIVISLSLSNDGAFDLFRLIRNNLKTKYTPVFALVVKTETIQQQQAQTMGFSAVVTKPIDLAELETRIAKAMNLDTSQRYYSMDGDLMVMKLPENYSPAVLVEVTTHLKPKFAEAVDAGFNKVVMDIHQIKTLHIGAIKLLVQAMQTCRDLGMQFALVGSPRIIAECRSFEDTRDWKFYEKLEEAKENLRRTDTAAAPQLAAAS